ncbi:MAG: dihydrodipicolinate synthase family protein [Verrucomicrobiota bacterium]|jgi:4-hydroxy-tetrahydrodipicolinate synthase
MKNPCWGGVFPAITTQLQADQSLDLEATDRSAEALLASGVSGIIFLGSLGENQALLSGERRGLIEAMVKAVAGLASRSCSSQSRNCVRLRSCR